MRDAMTPAQTPDLPATRPTIDRDRLERGLVRLDRIARLMDDQFEVPILKKRIGLDPIIGMIPGGGDWVVWFVSVYIFWEAARMGAPLGLLGRMGVNIGVDLVGGYVPGVGDLFDAFFKANRKNVEMLREHFGARPELGSPLPAVIPERALARTHPAVRYGAGALITLTLFALAALPFVLLASFFQG